MRHRGVRTHPRHRRADRDDRRRRGDLVAGLGFEDLDEARADDHRIGHLGHGLGGGGGELGRAWWFSARAEEFVDALFGLEQIAAQALGVILHAALDVGDLASLRSGEP